MLEFLIDLWDFMKVRKKFWLAPIVLVLLLLGMLIVLSEGSALAPFIYVILIGLCFIIFASQAVSYHLCYLSNKASSCMRGLYCESADCSYSVIIVN